MLLVLKLLNQLMKTEYPEKIYKTTRKTIKRIEGYQWKYRNIILLVLSIFVAYYILGSEQVVSFIQGFGNLGYPAAFIAGMFFSYGITIAPATVALFNLGQTLNPFLIAFIGAIGTVISDYIIFRFVRDRLLDEIKLLSKEVKTITKPVSYLLFWEEFRIRLWRAISRSKIWNLLIPVIAGFIIASPLPDEIGVALFGAVKFDPKKFVMIAYLLNFVGILIVAYSARIVG